MQFDVMISVLAGAGAFWLAAMATAKGEPKPFQWPAGKRVAVSLSFDDARTSQIDVGLPLLDRYGAKVTFYVNPPNMQSRLDGWKQAVAAGHEIGSHSNTHPCTVNYPFSAQNALESYTLAKMGKELDTASAAIEHLLGVKARTFAYPCGQKFVGRGARVKSYVPLVAARFLAGRGFRDEGPNDPARCDLAQLLGMESDGLTFEQMRDLVTAAAAQGGWLIFAGHEIGAPAHQTTQAAELEKFLEYARRADSGIWLDTVYTIGEYVRTHRARP
ncbi:MAG TPA: polysaccharide deacetylase family protein [Bryobacteraceae bacterium]|nr:polysaccharide deacetylase family protein [Bryobacteraceae bacterium]